MADIRTIRVTVDASQANQAAETLEIKLENAADGAKKAGEEVDKFGGKLSALKTGAGLLAAAFGAVLFGTDRLLNAMGQYQDLADIMGTTSEAVAMLGRAASISGVSLDKVAGASNKLQQNLSKLETEGSDTAAALKALGINADEFKKLKPEEQFIKVADSMAQFKDGTEKSAVAMGLYGKSGAELMPFFNDLAEKQNQNVRLTQDQIDAADAYGKASATMMTDLKNLAEIAAGQAAPAMTIFGTALAETLKQTLGVDDASNQLGKNTGIADFAMGAVQVLGYVGNAAQFIARTLQSMGLSIGAVAAMANRALDFDWEGVKAINKQANQDLKDIWAKPWMSDNVKKAIEDHKKALAEAGKEPPKAALNYDAQAAERAKKAREEAEKAAKAQEALMAKLKTEADSLLGKYDPLGKKQREYNEDLETLGKLSGMSAAELKKLGFTKAEVADLTAKAIKKHSEEKTVLEENIESVRNQIALFGISKEAREGEAAAIALSTQMKLQGQVVDEKQLQTLKDLIAQRQQLAKEEAFNEGMKDRIQAMRDEMALVGVYGKERERQAQEMAFRRDAEKAGIRDVNGAVAEQMKAYDALQDKVKAYNSSLQNGTKEAVADFLEETSNLAAIAKSEISGVLGTLNEEFANTLKTGEFNLNRLMIAVRDAFANMAAAKFSNALVSGVNSFFTAKADGGNFKAGSSIMVGEDGPEILRNVPFSGSIVPNHMINNNTSNSNAKSLSIQMGNVYVTGSGVSKADVQLAVSAAKSDMMAVITDEFRSGGLFSR